MPDEGELGVSKRKKRNKVKKENEKEMKEKAVTDASVIANSNGACSDRIWKEGETRGGTKEEQERRKKKIN